MGRMWAQDVFPTKDGGHTYLGFTEERKPNWFHKGIAKPIPLGNWDLLSPGLQREFIRVFKNRGYKLVTD